MTIDSNYEILTRSLKPINLFSPQRVKVRNPEKESEVEIVKFPHLINGFEAYHNTGASITSMNSPIGKYQNNQNTCLMDKLSK